MPVNRPLTDFAALGQQRRNTMVGEFLLFLRQNKKWWMLPILLVLALLTALVLLSGSGAAPFIYTIF